MNKIKEFRGILRIIVFEFHPIGVQVVIMFVRFVFLFSFSISVRLRLDPVVFMNANPRGKCFHGKQHRVFIWGVLVEKKIQMQSNDLWDFFHVPPKGH